MYQVKFSHTSDNIPFSVLETAKDRKDAKRVLNQYFTGVHAGGTNAVWESGKEGFIVITHYGRVLARYWIEKF